MSNVVPTQRAPAGVGFPPATQVRDGPGSLRLNEVDSGAIELFAAAPQTPVRWTVRLIFRGGIVEAFLGLAQSAQGIWTAPSGAQVAWFRDPDGKLLSLAEYPRAGDRDH